MSTANEELQSFLLDNVVAKDRQLEVAIVFADSMLDELRITVAD